MIGNETSRANARFFSAKQLIVEKLFSKIFAETKSPCIFANTKHNNIMTQTSNIVGWAVVYVATKNAKLFANMKNETIAAFHSQSDAIAYSDSCNMGGRLDELHIGYRVFPMQWIPKGMSIR